MNLETEIEKNSAIVSTGSYSMSIGELVSMYRDNELDLHPEFQRFFRWTDEQKSRLIESLLLGIPIPPIFVSERRDSKWDVIDGLQRLSTILQVMGELRDENKELKPCLPLTQTRYLPSLEGKLWDDDDVDKALPESARIKIKRSRLDINIVKNTSDDMAKYEIFQRLNRGGTEATDQELRNCILIMANREFYNWVQELGKYENFRNCILFTERGLEEAFDLELVTRFVVLATIDVTELSKIDELGSFLTDKLVEKSKDPSFDRPKVNSAFTRTFDFLSDLFEQDGFRRYDPQRGRYLGATLVSLFEIVAAGLAHSALRADSGNINPCLRDQLVARVRHRCRV